jgi:DNA repair protein RecN (Recombination protein N)
MLTALSIRDVVLIERLELSFGPGLTALTGETGAGKSILLDSLGLALGGRADAGLIRTGAKEAHVTACFAPAPGHPVFALLQELGLPEEPELTLRRVVDSSGRSRAFVNDSPCSVTALKRVGGALVEISGQHDQMGLADPVNHQKLLDAFGVPVALPAAVVHTHRAFRAAASKLARAREAIAQAARDEEFLRFAVDELTKLNPHENEETDLAARRQAMQQSERRAEAVAAALSEITPRDRRSAGPAGALRAASRALARLTPSRGSDIPADLEAEAVMAALERAEEAFAEAEIALTRLAREAECDPRLLENIEERLFALRAMGRKHNVAVAELPVFLETLRARLNALDHGEQHVAACARETQAARAAFVLAAEKLSAARIDAAKKLETKIARELPPLKLERAQFFAQVSRLPEDSWAEAGADQVQFLIATNPGQDPGALGKIASGGELSRLMLALKVVLASGSTVPTLVFDEVDSGIGGATAAAVGERLTRVAKDVQVLVVTHSPQVAARGAAHLRVAKFVKNNRTGTDVRVLLADERREEIARMLAGEKITDAARAAAASLLGL